MERALTPEILLLALGGHATLPSAEELAQSIAEAEIQLLLGRQSRLEDLLEAAWYLHSVGSTPQAMELYGVDRQRAALAVSAHIFDVALRTTSLDPARRALLTFACEIAYLRSGLDPNSLAVYSRESPYWTVGSPFDDDPGTLSCQLGSALLAVDSSLLFPETERISGELARSARVMDLSDFRGTPLGAAEYVVRGVRGLLIYLTYGREEQLRRGLEALQIAVEDERGDLSSRWVAAHLADAGNGFARSSVWTALPPRVPDGIKRSLVFGTPRIATLWPPQLDAVRDTEADPLSTGTKYQLLSMPTSAGKTLLAQMIVGSHLAEARSGVCYVAPTRSLCQEVRQDLSQRLNLIDFTVGTELDYSEGFEPDVEVLTPERLMNMLRGDASAVLERFGLFVFDEVHNVGEGSRGWTYESALTFVYHRTRQSRHRLVLLSAALGNRAHFVRWLSGEPEEPVAEFHADWRGPRRLNCVWTTRALRDQSVTETRQSTTFPLRRRMPLVGRLLARPSRHVRSVNLETTVPIGELVLKVDVSGTESKDSGSTAFYRMLVPLIELLRDLGPVLVVSATKRNALLLATAIAEEMPTSSRPPLDTLAEYIAARLGDDHPLVRLVVDGVAYHHGALPGDVRTRIEDAVREGLLPVVVATTTLTEGINLPTRSVVISELGAWGAEGYSEFIRGARLLNALGRAGRAAKETEGTVVLAWNGRWSEEVFDELEPRPGDLDVTSTIATSDAVRLMERVEGLIREMEDSIYEVHDEPIGSLISTLWFVNTNLEAMGRIADVESVLTFARSTLAWQQLPDEARTQLERLAESVTHSYTQAPERARQRWGRSGASLSGAVALERMARSLARLELDEAVLEDSVATLREVLGEGRLLTLLTLPEAPDVAVYTARGGNRRQVDVDLLQLCVAWVEGGEIGDLGEQFLGEVEDLAFRAEQLGDLIGELFESYLPWTLNQAITWANEDRERRSEFLLPTDIPLLVRWGVASATAGDLIIRGLRSRSLAIALGRAWESETHGLSSILDWLRATDIRALRERLRLEDSAVIDVLELIRVRGPLATVIAGGQGEILLEPIEFVPSTTEEPVIVRRQARSLDLAVWRGERLVGAVAPGHAHDMGLLLDLGLELVLELVPDDERGVFLSVALAEPG